VFKGVLTQRGILATLDDQSLHTVADRLAQAAEQISRDLY
jgi:hypothetical protein